MSSSRWICAVAAAAVMLTIALPALAEEPDGRVSLGLSFGVVTAKMDQVNHLIALGNQSIGAGNLSGMKGLKNIDAGFEFEAELRARLNPWLAAGAGAQSISLKRQVSYNNVFSAQATAVPVEATAYWYMPWGAKLNENLDFFAGAGFTSLQNVQVRYHAEKDIPDSPQADRTEELIFKGSGAGVHALAGFEYLLTPHLTMLGEIGYRFAKATNLKPEKKITDAAEDNPDQFELLFLEAFRNPKSLDADFSGIDSRVTFRFYLF